MSARREESTATTTPFARRALVMSFLLVVALACAMTFARVRVTLADPNFDAHDAAGILKSDPGLLYYLTERVIESHGALPDDFHADPRIEHPAVVDVPRTLPVAQEFVVAWLRLAIGDALPLHVFCLWVAGAFASATLIGTWLLARELTGDAWLALLAALLAASLPASWRTTGFVLMDEDFSLPFLALHLGLLARAARVRTNGAFLASAVTAAVAVATWHATQFLLALEVVAVLFVVFARGVPTRASDAASDAASVERGAWIHALVLASVGLIVPFLRVGAFALSIPVAAAVALALVARFARSGSSVLATRAVLVGVTIGIVGIATYLRGHVGDGTYDHVFALLAAKLEHGGELPVDPRALTPDVRLMWQGPFATLDAANAWSMLGVVLGVLPLGAYGAWRERGAARRATYALAVASFVGAFAIQRVVVLPAIVAPAVAAALAIAWLGVRNARLALSLVVLLQGVLGVTWLAHYENPWYASPRQRQAEIAALVAAVPRLVPEGEAIAADSMNATAILVHTRRAAILSPKWESAASRARVVEFLHSFAHDSPAAFQKTLVERYRVRYLLVDRFTLGYVSAYAAGFPPGEPRAGTAAAAFLSTDAAVLEGQPGFELLYRSPASIRQSNGAPTDFFRLYRVTP